MKRAVNTGLPNVGRPFEWATIADGVLYTVQLPLKADGSFETGDIGIQTELTLTNLRRTVKAAGGTMDDVTQVLVYLPNPEDFAGMNEVYGRHFSKPYPSRATVVASLIAKGVRIEIVAHAHIKPTIKSGKVAKPEMSAKRRPSGKMTKAASARRDR